MRSPGFDDRVRTTLAIGLLVLVLSVSALRQFAQDWREFDHRRIGLDGISLYEQRFDRLKRLLPPRGVVGYVSDTPAYSAEFFLTQYALSPVIVDPNRPHEIVVGNFANRASRPQTWQDRPLMLQADLANGLKLFTLASR